ncbi:MAG: four helix bundle suffix domain-containing protein [bacterium]|nr:four helix bundle suffix domain-containing protein [bacterium]
MSYKDLKTYQNSTIIYDFTVDFCNRFVVPPHYTTYQTDKSYSPQPYPSNRSYRTADQMVQAARSGKQNIVEGSTERASKKSEIKLVSVSRASFQELLEDYEDFLRQHSLPLWEKDFPQAVAVRQLVYLPDKSYQTYRSYLSSPENAANAIICLINQNNFLLDRQIKSLEEAFIKEGGYTEQLFKKRLAHRAIK